MLTIQKPSAQSLYLRLRVNGRDLATGTGIVALKGNQPYLITNWHNLSGRDPTTDKTLSPTGGQPDEVIIIHNRKDRILEWVEKREPLYINGQKLWIEHPQHAQKVDVVALRLTDTDNVDFYPYSCAEPGPDILVGPADTVSVVGFPFGLTGGGALAIWATGFMATEPDVDQAGLPMFYIDCRARSGQSGSAVIAHRNGGKVAMTNGGVKMFSGPVTRFLGIYSGRINKESDLGIVWKPRAVSEILEHASD